MKNLVVLSVFCAVSLFFSGRCEGQPTVTVLGEFDGAYLGDTMTLSCSESSNIKWYKNGEAANETKQNFSVTITSINDKYTCQSNGKMSNKVPSKIFEFLPQVYLATKSGNSVVYASDSAVLVLHVYKSHQDWKCYVLKNQKLQYVYIQKYPNEGEPLEFITPSLDINGQPFIYWCKNNKKNIRSNTVALTVTDLMVKLVSHPHQPVLGSHLELECIANGGAEIQKVKFYKNEKKIKDEGDTKYIIKNLTASDNGNYECEATYMFQMSSSKLPNTVRSVNQDITGIGAPVPVMSYSSSKAACTCNDCRGQNMKSIFYMITEGNYKQAGDTNLKHGKYTCTVTWDNGASTFSEPITVSSTDSNAVTTWIIVLIAVILLIIILVAVIWILVKRNAKKHSEALYEEMPLKPEGGYQDLNTAKSEQRSAEYETLKGERGEGETKAEVSGSGQQAGYDVLKISEEEKRKNEYQTLGPSEAKGAEGGYEALKSSKAEGTEGMYHVIGLAGGKEAVGGYEALKLTKEESKEGDYQTLKEGGN